MEGSKALWLSSCRMNILKVAPEHVRPATAEENLSQSEAIQQIAAMNEESMLPRGQQQFYEITGQEPPRSPPFRVSFPQGDLPRRDVPRPPPAASRSMEPEQEPRPPRTELREQMPEAGGVPVPDSPVHDEAPTVKLLQLKTTQAVRGTKD